MPGLITHIPAIRTATATWAELPPNTKFTPQIILMSEFELNEFAAISSGAAGLTETHGQAYGQEIVVSGSWIPALGTKPTMSNALAFRNTLIGYLLATTGKPKIVDLCEFADSAKAKLGIWRSCVLTSIRFSTPSTIRRVGFEFTMRSPYPVMFASGSDAGNSIPTTSTATYKAYQAAYQET